LAFETVGAELVPRYLVERDQPWLRALLDEHARYEGARRAELSARLREPLSPVPPKKKLQMVVAVLEKLTSDRPEAAVPPISARKLVFERASEQGGEALATVAAELGVGEEQLADALFADLPSERRILPLPRELSPASLALLANQELAAALLGRSSRVRITLWGRARQVVRHAQRVGLLCVAHVRPADAVELEVSGPLALFRNTRVYGRALASLIPRLGWCERFELCADVDVGEGSSRRLVLTQNDPIFVSREPRQFDSAVEERFAREFGKLAKEWHLVREPTALSLDGRLVFPDFELVHRRDATRRVLLEIVGYWTPEYLSKKLAALKKLAGRDWILCVNERLGCSERDFPDDARVVWFKRRIEPRAVLSRLEA
jgi:hypothetical protein